MTKRKQASHETPAPRLSDFPLEDVNLKVLLHKCWFVERRPVEGVFLWKRNYPSHLSHYLRCPTALVRTSERMM